MNRRLLILLLFASLSSFSSAQDVDPAKSFVFAELESRPMNLAISKNRRHFIVVDALGQLIDFHPKKRVEQQRFHFPEMKTQPPEGPNVFPFMSFDAKSKTLFLLSNDIKAVFRRYTMKKTKKRLPEGKRTPFSSKFQPVTMAILPNPFFGWGIDQKNTIIVFLVEPGDKIGGVTICKVVDEAKNLSTIAVTTKGKIAGAVGTKSGAIFTFATKGVEVKRKHTHHKDAVRFLKFLPGKSSFVSSTGEKELVYWRASKEEPVKVVPFAPEIVSMVYSAKGKYLATGLSNGKVAIWNARETEPLVLLTTSESGAAFNLAFSPDGKDLFAVGYGKKILGWHLRSAISQRKRK